MSNQILKIINTKNLEHNIKFIKSQTINNEQIYAVVKSNAYGHGLKICQKILEKYVNGYCVATNSEALTLRKLTAKPIIVLSALNLNQIVKCIENEIEFFVSSNYELKLLSEIAKKVGKIAKIHLKIDTGMHRLGFSRFRSFKKAISIIKNSQNLHLSAICSHNGGDSAERTSNQFIKFKKFAKLAPCVDMHIANTQTFFNFPCMHLNISRIGIGLYGYENKNLKPVLSIKAKIVNILNVKIGAYVGYGTEHIAKNDMKIAVVSIGYADGLNRIYAKQGYFIVNGKKAKIIANICMNMTMIDISKIKDVSIGDYATVLGSDGNIEISAYTIAKKCKTIEYEILTNFSHIKPVIKI